MPDSAVRTWPRTLSSSSGIEMASVDKDAGGRPEVTSGPDGRARRSRGVAGAGHPRDAVVAGAL